MILEANASGEYRNIGPFYYEQYLKDRYANGANGRKCFDILRASVIYDLGRIGQLAGIGCKSAWGSCFGNQTFSNTFASTMQGKMDAEKSNFKQMLENMAKYVNN